ncbi:MAG: PadR family transcriptional regulator [Clostridia bacterium]|nr:PadR family transcriptional regulator [Clostridia bacterium]
MAQNSDFLRGHTETIILRLLTEKDSYGYEISKNIVDSGQGLVDIKDATIYTAFRRMENDGLLATYWGDGVGGARRRYYAITEKGRRLYAEKKEEWTKLKSILDYLIIGSDKNV